MTCIITIIFLNVATFILVSRHSKKLLKAIPDIHVDFTNAVLEKERKVGKMVAFTTLSLFLSIFPIIVLESIDPNAAVTYKSAWPGIYAFACSFVVLDPMAYILCHKKYRDEIKNLLRPMCGFMNDGSAKSEIELSTMHPRCTAQSTLA